MRLVVTVSILSCFICFVGAPPVTNPPPKEDERVSEFDMEYYRYFKEVIDVLDTDKDFRDKLMKVDENDIKSGKVALELDFVNHNVRTKLDEVKRRELERLRHLATKQYELINDIDTAHAKVSQQMQHVDHNNPHTFEIEDLRKLFVQAMDDLNKADQERQKNFKEYEMQKEFEKQQKLKSLDEEHKKAYEKELKEKEDKHKKHEPLHHPMSKQHVEEVWEKQDHMEKEALDLRSFFMMHDVDGNGYWDEVEVKALFMKELDKMYQNGAPEDDMLERHEEMERMREHVFKESDRNKDGLISYEEFLIQTRRDEWEKDKGWKGLDEQQVYSPDEYHEYERRRLEDMQRMIDQGLMHPPQAGQFSPGHPQQQYPPQYHPNAIPQGNYGQPNYPQGQQQYYQPQFQPQYQGHPQAPQYQGHPQQVPQGHPQQVPQGHPQQAPQGHPQQVPQGNSQQVPQGQPQQAPQGYPQQHVQQQQHPQQVQQQNPQQVQQQNPQQGQPQQVLVQNQSPQPQQQVQSGQAQQNPQQEQPQQVHQGQQQQQAQGQHEQVQHPPVNH